MNAEELFLSNLGLIDRIAAYVCRRNHFKDDESDDFPAHVRLRLIENDYAILRKFEGRSSFSTYLTTVIQRLSLQYRIQMWGKWRPSAEAQRLGDAGVTLERMMTRDGYSFHEALEILTTRANPAFSRAELEAVHARLPHRSARPELVEEGEDARNVASLADTEDIVMQRERDRAARATMKALDAAIAEKDAEDQMVLRMRFWSQLAVPAIAAALGLDVKKLYKRLDRLMIELRRSIERTGIDRNLIADMLQSGEVDLGQSRLASGEIAGLRRSVPGEKHVTEEGLQPR